MEDLPYCERQAASGRAPGEPSSKPTRLEPEDVVTSAEGRHTRLEGDAARAEPAQRGPAPTRLEPPEAPSRGRTVLQPDASPSSIPASIGAGAPQPSVAVAGPAGTGRLVAVLAAPGLGAAGAVFPVRAGKNTVGTGRGNDIVIGGDPEVSREHAVLLHRSGTFHLADRLSTNGTWVNGREVPANGSVPLRDRDRIRVGATELCS